MPRRDGVELLVFPEALLGGYPRGRVRTVIGQRSSSGREEFLAYSRETVEVPGPQVDELRGIAADNRIHLVVGLIERAETTLYCAAVTIDDIGELIGRRRKVMPTGSERLVWGQGDGSTLFHPARRVDAFRQCGDGDLLGKFDAGVADDVLRARGGPLVRPDG